MGELLTIVLALGEFRTEIDAIYPDAVGWHAFQDRDYAFLDTGHGECAITTERLALDALLWLAEKGYPLQQLGPDWDHPAELSPDSNGTRRWTYATNACIPADPVRWLLEEVRSRL